MNLATKVRAQAAEPRRPRLEPRELARLQAGDAMPRRSPDPLEPHQQCRRGLQIADENIQTNVFHELLLELGMKKKKRADADRPRARTMIRSVNGEDTD